MNIEKRGSASTMKDFLPKIKRMESKDYLFDYKNVKELILSAIINKENITIVGDYDADGVCSSSILAGMLYKLGYPSPKIRIPLRFSEGYGLNPVIVDEIESGLMITVDNGIAAKDAIQKAKDKGLKVVVIDHHLPSFADDGETLDLPNADCIVDPHVERMLNLKGHYDFYDYCGSGLAYKVAAMMLDGVDNYEAVVGEYAALAAIATVADSVPILDDNREIYKKGTAAILNANITSGLAYLFSENRVNLLECPVGIKPHEYINTETIGYYIAPCINAPGRVIEKAGTDPLCTFLKDGGDGAQISLRCVNPLYSAGESMNMAKKVIALNAARKNITSTEVDRVEKIIGLNKMWDNYPLVVFVPDAKPGLVGLVAGKISEKYGRPTIIITNTEDENVCRGSCRNVDGNGIHIRGLLDHASDLLLQYGGHEGAAGLEIETGKIDEFRKRLNDLCVNISRDKKKMETVYYDLEMDASLIPDVHNALRRYAPFGVGNPNPVFLIRNYEPERIVARGAEKRHLSFVNSLCNGIMFNLSPESVAAITDEKDSFDIVATMGFNCFRGVATPQLSIEAIRLSDGTVITPEQ